MRRLPNNAFSTNRTGHEKTGPLAGFLVIYTLRVRSVQLGINLLDGGVD